MKKAVCEDCKETFNHTSPKAKPPKRCKACRQRRARINLKPIRESRPLSDLPFTGERRPEPTYLVDLSCGCELKFPKPLPVKGDPLWCLLHEKEVRAE